MVVASSRNRLTALVSTDLMQSISEKLSFKPFDERAPVRIYRNAFVPHLRQSGCTYFVTFRLADSIPKSVLLEWKTERWSWLKARGIDVEAEGWRGKFESLSDQDKRTFERSYAKRLFEELDKCHGDNSLKHPNVSAEVVGAIQFFDGDRFDLGDFVIMSNHVHMLMTPLGEFQLEDILHSIKSYSANRINRLLSRDGSFWMAESYDRLVRDGEELVRTQNYIRSNPAKVGLKEGDFVQQEASFEIDA